MAADVPSPPDPVRVSVVRATDPARFLATDQLVWFNEPTSLTPEEHLASLPPDQRFGADVEGADPAAYAGIYGVYPMVLSVPGGAGAPAQVGVAGLTWVGVHPDQRRRGVLRAMIGDHLARTRAEGYCVSALHASEPVIYGRYGYGMAQPESVVTLGRGTELSAPGLEEAVSALTTRIADLAEPGMAARLRACDQVVAGSELGTAVMSEEFYERLVTVTPAQLRDKEPRRVLFATSDGVDVGSAVLRRGHRWTRGHPEGELEVSHLVGGPAARLALLKRLVDFDLIGSVRLPMIGPDDPLWHWLPSPRSVADAFPSEALWIRIVDLPAALAARGYAAECDVVVEVTDALLPDNGGRWRLSVRAGTGTVTRASDAPDVLLDIEVLGSAWLGSTNLVARHRAGQLTERRAGSVAQLWRAMRADVAATPTLVF